MCFTRFADDAIYVYGYRFPPASVFPCGKIAYERIADVDPLNRRITTKDGEILFIGSEKSLKRLHIERGVPIVRRLDVWSLIAEPFLDGTFDDEHNEQTLQTLEENGISRPEVERFRAILKDDMLEHNAYYQEWFMNDMREVLIVKSTKLLFSSWSKSKRDEFRDFYWKFMEIALRPKAFEPDEA